LEDVWIVDENNIWVVGQIVIPDPDSSWNGTGFETFNAAHWDGSYWNLSRFERGAPLNSIWYFSENDIWATGGVPIHWDGEKWSFYHLWNMGILDNNDGGVDHIWASSLSDVYFVGRKGSIVHYDGSTFTKMESGTDVDLIDIDGTPDGSKIFVSGYNYIGELAGKSVILELKDGTWERLLSSTGYFGDIENDDYGRYMSVKIFGDIAYFTTGATDLLKFNYKRRELAYIPKNTTILGGKQLESMDGNDFNDIMFVSPLDLVFHYNGSTYFQDEYIDETFPHELYYLKVRLKDDIAAVFGTTGVNGFIAIGHRN